MNRLFIQLLLLQLLTTSIESQGTTYTRRNSLPGEQETGQVVGPNESRRRRTGNYGYRGQNTNTGETDYERLLRLLLEDGENQALESQVPPPEQTARDFLRLQDLQFARPAQISQNQFNNRLRREGGGTLQPNYGYRRPNVETNQQWLNRYNRNQATEQEFERRAQVERQGQINTRLQRFQNILGRIETVRQRNYELRQQALERERGRSPA